MSTAYDRVDRIAPQSGVGFELKQGDRLHVIDAEGGQVADLFCFAACDRTDALSSGRSIDYNETVSFSVPHILYSNKGLPMLTIVQDTCGTHDFLVTPCSLQMFRMIHHTTHYHPSCLENLAAALAPYSIAEERITTTFNIFMNVPVAADGKIKVLPPRSKAGDFIVLEAQMDLIVGLTACSDEGSNGGACKAIMFKVLRAEPPRLDRP